MPNAQPSKTEPSGPLSLERVVFFSDAVFAIAMTLLVLDLRLPDAGALDNDALLAQLLGMWQKYLAYGLSFLVIGIFWASHVRRFRYIKRTDRRLILLNLLLLMVVAFLPFPTAVISENTNRTATLFYALSVLAAGLLNLAIFLYAAGGRRLIDAELSPDGYRRELLRGLAQPAIFLLSVPIAFINADWAKLFWVLLFPALLLVR